MSIKEEEKRLHREESIMGHKLKELHRQEKISEEEKQEIINDKIRYEINQI